MSSCLNKTVLIGISSVDVNNELIATREMFGTIIAVNADDSIDVLLNDGTTWSMPVGVRALTPAEPGEYRLQSTREIVRDPDFVTVWTEVVGDGAGEQ